MGIIESLEMTQFMCHKYLTFSLGPQINCIIGASVQCVVYAPSQILNPCQDTTEVRMQLHKHEYHC